MQLTISDDEADVLVDFLDQHFGALSMEISHTDNPAYRQDLRRRRDSLRGIRDSLRTMVMTEEDRAARGTGNAAGRSPDPPSP